ncbi:hypothetical protein J3L18_22040 [Mucilaginibacter gossypii]|uniref:hypothetical protein n=1 Tax=Mucilaginibacter gossypii TaxID=551996 RepID=UPI0016760CA6|nr:MULTISPECIES: hypothetical protein [Mucilaginibacter]QTE35811.1 hypothetical protein J3L18_22040 [Mucilaginibacter gossypii]
MENNNQKDFKELASSEVRDLQLAMRHFFINYPQEKLKGVIWDLYRGWVFNSAEYVEREEIKDMLLFYEAILEFMNDVNNYCQYLDRTVLKSD